MDPQELKAAAEPGVLGGYLSRLPQPPVVHHHGPAKTVRTDLYEGHRIVITTSYEITVDGRPVGAHFGVDNSGRLHCHALPAYQFPSAVDAVRTLIDHYPEEYPAPDEPPADPPGHGPGHEHHGGG